MMAFPVLDRKEKRIQARERGRKGRAKPDCKGAVKQTNQHPEKRLFAPSLGREGKAEKGSSGFRLTPEHPPCYTTLQPGRMRPSQRADRSP
jgi:hypothetical protein